MAIVSTPLLNVAWQAQSPSHAAKIVSHLGYPKKIVQATRWAAIIVREERRGNFPSGSFWNQLGPNPHSEIDMPRMETRSFAFEVFCRSSNSWDALNAAEREKLLPVIVEALMKFGIRVQTIVDKKEKEPESQIRFEERKDD